MSRADERPALLVAVFVALSIILPGIPAGAYELSSTTTEPADSTTGVVESGELPFQIRTRQIKVQVTPEVDLILPDGDSRITVEHEAAGRVLTVGTRYNYFAGKISYWLGYTLPLPVDPLLLSASVSDDIGFGRVYYDAKYLERARNGRVGTGWKMPFASVVVSVGRTSWQLAPYASPALSQTGLIDAVEAVVSTLKLPQVFEPIEPDETILRFRHAFLGMGGNYRYNRAEAQLAWSSHLLRNDDDLNMRGFSGLAFDISPVLPARETFALGGANGIKGYRYEEFRGPGMTIGGAEYGLLVPWKFDLPWLGLNVEKVLAVGFAEGGRIDADWLRPETRWKYSGGLGARLEGTFLRHYHGRLRFYAAQAGGMTSRRPVYYALMDLR